MNKKLIILIVAVVVLLGGGYYFLSQKGGGSLVVPGGGDDGGAFSSIKDALGRSMSLVCEYTDEEGVETKTYIKNKAVRVSTAGGGEREPADIIMKENKMYMWNGMTKQGFVYTFEDADTDITEGMDLGDADNRANVLNAIEAYKDKCKVSTVADSYFTPPADINFQDMSSFFENMSNYQQDLPEGLEE